MFASKSSDDTSTLFYELSLTNGLRHLYTPMAILEALAVLERKKRNIDTPTTDTMGDDHGRQEVPSVC